MNDFISIITSIPKADTKMCFDAGYDSEMHGANETNCAFWLFSSRENTRAWEDGVRKAREDKQKKQKRCRDAAGEGGRQGDNYAIHDSIR